MRTKRMKTTKTYVADDGVVFETAAECRAHEAKEDAIAALAEAKEDEVRATVEGTGAASPGLADAILTAAKAIRAYRADKK